MQLQQSFFDTSYHGYKVRVSLIRENITTYKPFQVSGPGEVHSFLKNLENCDRERFISILLDTKNQIVGVEEISIGILNASLVCPRELLKSAILANAGSIIIAHNHASGKTDPSSEDREITKVVSNACDLLGIRLLDHIIIGLGSYLSFAEQGLLQKDGRTPYSK